jgi:site-specific recombinase XerD
MPLKIEHIDNFPPKFLRSAEVKKLFAGLSLSSATAIRTHAMVHLAYFYGSKTISSLCGG